MPEIQRPVIIQPQETITLGGLNLTPAREEAIIRLEHLALTANLRTSPCASDINRAYIQGQPQNPDKAIRLLLMTGVQEFWAAIPVEQVQPGNYRLGSIATVSLETAQGIVPPFQTLCTSTSPVDP